MYIVVGNVWPKVLLRLLLAYWLIVKEMKKNVIFGRVRSATTITFTSVDCAIRKQPIYVMKTPTSRLRLYLYVKYSAGEVDICTVI